MKYLNESKEVKNLDDVINFSNGLSKIRRIDMDPETEMPISVVGESEWIIITNPERYQRTYVFDDMKEVEYFFNEIYKYQFKIEHHCKLIVDNLEVTVETYTHSFNGITEQDIKIKNTCDDLYNDVNFFKEKDVQR